VLVEAATTATNAANTAYLDALHTYNQDCRAPNTCLAVLCKNPQPGNCVAAQGSTQGACGGGTGN